MKKVTGLELYEQNNLRALENGNSFVKCNLLGDLCSCLGSTFSVAPLPECKNCLLREGHNAHVD